MINIEDPAKTNKIPPFLRLAFRPLFFGGALFSAVAILLWIATLQGWLQFQPLGGTTLWHGHEMLFGFTAAIIAGFLLTAVQNWTGIPGINSNKLLLLASLWLAGRCLMATSLMPTISATIDILFIPSAAFVLAKPVVAIKQYRNLIFVPVLIAMTIANTLFHYGILFDQISLSQQGLQFMIWLVVLMMTILGGRVIPFFTANGTQTLRAEPMPLLEMAVIVSTIFLAVIYGLGLSRFITDTVQIILLVSAGVLHGIRCLRWRGWITGQVPLLWSLHIAYAFIPLGLLALALSHAVTSLSASTASHLLTAGAMGTMIISMMARVSLGHTGRPLQPHRLMSLAFVAVITAALLRSFGPWLLPALTPGFWLAAAICWAIGFGIFSAIYWPILSQARADGRPG
jgi:uncharacterized protein involved in response to NO